MHLDSLTIAYVAVAVDPYKQALLILFAYSPGPDWLNLHSGSISAR